MPDKNKNKLNKEQNKTTNKRKDTINKITHYLTFNYDIVVTQNVIVLKLKIDNDKLNNNYIKIQGIKQLLKVNGLDNLECYYEPASALLINNNNNNYLLFYML